MAENLMIGDVLQFEVVRHVTLPLFKMEDENFKYYFRFEKGIEQGRELAASKRQRKVSEGSDQKEPLPPPDLAEVTNLRTGELGQIIVNAVLKSNLEDTYPDAGYVGKSFQIQRLKSIARGSRTIKMFEILEIKLKQLETPAPTSTKKK
jgi:hypothetical protein